MYVGRNFFPNFILSNYTFPPLPPHLYPHTFTPTPLPPHLYPRTFSLLYPRSNPTPSHLLIVLEVRYTDILYSSCNILIFISQIGAADNNHLVVFRNILPCRFACNLQLATGGVCTTLYSQPLAVYTCTNNVYTL